MPIKSKRVMCGAYRLMGQIDILYMIKAPEERPEPRVFF